MSQFVKLLMIVLAINLCCYLAFPSLHIGKDVVDKLLKIEKDDQGNIINVWGNENLNKSMTIENNGIIPGTFVFIGNSIDIIKSFLLIIPNFFCAPFLVLKHCMNGGMPPAVAVLVGGFIVGSYFLAVMDFIWTKN